MKYPNRILAASLCMLALVGCEKPEPVVNEQSLIELVIAMEKGATSKDAQVISNGYAPTAIIDIQLPSGNHPLAGTMTREQYREKLAALMQTASSYQITWENPNIQFGPDGKSAKVTVFRTETLVSDSKTLQIKSLEQDEVGIVDKQVVLLRQTLTTPNQ